MRLLYLDPSWLKLLRSCGPIDRGEGFAEIGGDGVGGGDELLSGADLDGAVAAGGAHEPADRPAGALLDEAAHGDRGEHDDQVGFDRFALAVVGADHDSAVTVVPSGA